MPRRSSANIARQKIIESFSKLALKKSYKDISLKEISELAGISVPSFYTYFDSKEDMLRYYIDYSLEHLEKAISSHLSQAASVSITIRYLLHILSTLLEDRILTAFHRVFREYEFVEKSLAKLYYRRLFDLLRSFIGERLYELSYQDPRIISLAIVGSSSFIYLFRKIFNLEGNILIDIEVSGDLVLKGLGSQKIPKITPIKEPPSLMELIEKYNVLEAPGIPRGKKPILISTLDILNSKGFKDTKIYEIMDRAGYSVGSFYKIYRSKEELLEDLVIIIGRVLRRYLSECIEGIEDPVETEAKGSACFLGFIRRNENIQHASLALLGGMRISTE
jgi:AcrR family transcriptional regulator